MPYALKSDIEGLYGPALLDVIADRDRDGKGDKAVVDQALASASAEIDGFLSQRYTLPLDPAPAVLKQYCIDIAVYRMSPTDDNRTEEMRRRYEDAIAFLTKVAEGKLGLGSDSDGDAVSDRGTAGALTWSRA